MSETKRDVDARGAQSANPTDETLAHEQADKADTAREETLVGATESRSVPEKIGRYTVVQPLGSGGQGSVYRAIHPTLPLDVAIKVSSRPVEGEIDAALRDEAQILCDLDHPNIARIRDLDVDEGRPFLVLDFIRGRSLEEVMTAGTAAMEQSVSWLGKVARALDFAHRRGVLHLDLKPANIVINEKDEPVVIDFGLARMRGAWRDSSLEADGIGGTLSYMSPEQADGVSERITARSDIFALGAILYRILVGRPPFQGDSISRTLEQIRRCDFDCEALEQADADRRLIAVCRKALSADPRDRFASAADFAEALAPPPAESAESAEATSGGSPRRSMSISFLGITITLAVAGLLLVMLVPYLGSQLTSGTGQVAYIDNGATPPSEDAGTMAPPPSLPQDQNDKTLRVQSRALGQVPLSGDVRDGRNPRLGGAASIGPAPASTAEAHPKSRKTLDDVQRRELLGVLREVVRMDVAKVTMARELRNYADSGERALWLNIQSRATADRKKLAVALERLEALESEFVVDQTETFRLLLTDLGRKQQIYEELLEKKAEQPADDRPKLKATADDYDALIQRLHRHEQTIRQYLTAPDQVPQPQPTAPTPSPGRPGRGGSR